MVVGMQWGEFMTSPVTDTARLLFGDVIIMLVVDCVVYMLIALYLEQVLPGPYGTPKPWYFLFQRQFWCCGNKTAPGNSREVPGIKSYPHGNRCKIGTNLLKFLQTNMS